jgi:hypothetical protein
MWDQLEFIRQIHISYKNNNKMDVVEFLEEISLGNRD